MDRDALRRQLVRDEGLRLRLYVDTVGKTTIGAGRNLTDRGINLAEATFLLNNDIDACWSDLCAFYPPITTISDVRQRALVNLCFMGIGTLKQFRRMWAAIRAGDWSQAADHLLDSRYATQVGDRAQRLAHMLRTNTDPP